jgi:hypothetical protein
MPKKDQQDAGPNKIPRTIYLTKETAQRLEKAADAEGVSNSVYVEQTLRARFKKEGVQ